MPRIVHLVALFDFFLCGEDCGVDIDIPMSARFSIFALPFMIEIINC